MRIAIYWRSFNLSIKGVVKSDFILSTVTIIAKTDVNERIVWINRKNISISSV